MTIITSLHEFRIQIITSVRAVGFLHICNGVHGYEMVFSMEGSAKLQQTAEDIQKAIPEEHLCMTTTLKTIKTITLKHLKSHYPKIDICRSIPASTTTFKHLKPHKMPASIVVGLNGVLPFICPCQADQGQALDGVVRQSGPVQQLLLALETKALRMRWKF